MSAPADGRVKRILDMGCGIGQLTVGLKKQHPDAEVWGIDHSAPMVRYAHRRAVDLGVDVHFRQALAHRTGFADGSVDLVTAYILFHARVLCGWLQLPSRSCRGLVHAPLHR